MSQISVLGEEIAVARSELVAGRQAIAGMHARGLDSLQVCGRLTSLVDRVVLRLFDGALAELSAAKRDAARAGIALAGLGSYGRRQSAPFSDVDLMILHQGVAESDLNQFVRRFTSAIYDVHLTLGHSLRTPFEAVQLARQDAVICTSLIDSRLVAGSQTHFQDFRDAFAKMVRRKSRSVALAMHEARGKERKQYGESIYLLEPHIKRSRGGLRDLHLVQWLGFVEYGESDPDRLHLLGAMTKFDYRRLLNARAYLLRLRNEMHFHAGSSKDTLDRAEQMRIAAWLGHQEREGLLPVEHFMRDYFRHTSHLWQMVRRREAALLAHPTAVNRILGPVFNRNVTGDYRLTARHISATTQGLAKLPGNLDEVLRLVDLASQSEKLLDHATWSVLLLSAPECPESLTPPAAERFRLVLGKSPTVGNTLRILHELGYLEKFVPAVRRARCLLQFNQYHKYTVDEHCLRAVQQAAEFSPRDDDLGRAYREIKDKALLHLALLLHDLGKGDDRDHSELGAQLAVETAHRLRLDEYDTQEIAFLVRKHLAMSHLAFRRDLSDPRIVEQFAQQLGSAERLRMLFVLTCADLAAVGPGVLTRWKVDVLADLYRRTLARIEKNSAGEADLVSAQIERVQHALAAMPGVGVPGAAMLGPATAETKFKPAPDPSHATPAAATPKAATPAASTSAGQTRADDPWIARQLHALPPTFLLAFQPQEIARTLATFRGLAPRQASAWGRSNQETRTVEFVAGIETGVGRGAFSSMAGALSARGLQIISADTFVIPGELLVLHYVAIDPDCQEGTPPERLEQVSAALVASVDSLDPPKFRRVFGQEQALASVRLTQLPNRVRVDNEASADATVVEVFTFDRTGLLYELARHLHDLELTIRHAKISTYIDQVVDVFYVTERHGGKVLDEQRIDTIQQEMHHVIQADPR